MNGKTKQTVLYALLTAIIVLMSFTPIGYFKTFGLEITFITIPVIVGAILMGPAAGAVLGGIFGVTSFIQCFGMSAFGSQLLLISAPLTFIVCIPTRILMGYCCGLIFKLMKKKFGTKMISFGAGGLSGAVLNTLFFMTALVLCFGHTDYIAQLRGELNILPFIMAFIGINGVVEAAVCTVLGSAVSSAVYKAVKR